MAISVPSLPRYPSTFPRPQASPHSGVIDSGLIRSTQKGFPQQFRDVGSAPTRMRLVVRVRRSEWADWVSWINTYAITRWCLMPMVDQYSSIDPTEVYDWSVVKVLDRVRASNVGENWIDAAFEVDVWPGSIGISRTGQAATGQGGQGSVWPGMPLLPGVLPSQNIVTGPIVSYPINARRYALIPVKPNPLSTRNPNPTENPTTWTKIAEVLTPNPWERDPLAVGFDDYYQVPPPNSRSSDSSVGAVPDDTSDPGFYDFQGTVQVYSGIGFQSSGVPPQLPPVDIEVPHVSEADFLGDYAYFQNVLDGNVSPSGAEVTHLYNGFSFVAGQRVVLPSQSNPPDIYFEAPFGNITQQSRDVGTLALTAPDQPDAFMAGTTKIVSVLDSDIPANLGLRQSWLTNAYFNMPAKILVKVNVSAFVDYTYVFTLRDFVPGRVIVDRGLGIDNNSDFSAWGYSASGMSHAVFDYARYEAFEKVIEPINLNPIAGSANISIGNAITNPGGTGTGTDTGPTIIIP